jgi:hypothetical protein
MFRGGRPPWWPLCGHGSRRGGDTRLIICKHIDHSIAQTPATTLMGCRHFCGVVHAVLSAWSFWEVAEGEPTWSQTLIGLSVREASFLRLFICIWAVAAQGNKSNKRPEFASPFRTGAKQLAMALRTEVATTMMWGVEQASQRYPKSRCPGNHQERPTR